LLLVPPPKGKRSAVDQISNAKKEIRKSDELKRLDYTARKKERKRGSVTPYSIEERERNPHLLCELQGGRRG